ncbi:hypothetical protein ANCDUO_08610, partial [Ancylostoma duodenale]
NRIRRTDSEQARIEMKSFEETRYLRRFSELNSPTKILEDKQNNTQKYALYEKTKNEFRETGDACRLTVIVKDADP